MQQGMNQCWALFEMNFGNSRQDSKDETLGRLKFLLRTDSENFFAICGIGLFWVAMGSKIGEYVLC